MTSPDSEADNIPSQIDVKLRRRLKALAAARDCETDPLKQVFLETRILGEQSKLGRELERRPPGGHERD